MGEAKKSGYRVEVSVFQVRASPGTVKPLAVDLLGLVQTIRRRWLCLEEMLLQAPIYQPKRTSRIYLLGIETESRC